MTNGEIAVACGQLISKYPFEPVDAAEVKRASEYILALAKQHNLPPDLFAVSMLCSTAMELPEVFMAVLPVCLAARTELQADILPADKQVLVDKMRSGELRVIVAPRWKARDKKLDTTKKHCVICGVDLALSTNNLPEVKKSNFQPCCATCFKERLKSALGAPRVLMGGTDLSLEEGMKLRAMMDSLTEEKIN